MESTAAPDRVLPRPRVLPVLLAALVAPGDDPRQFLRHPISLEVGVGVIADARPEYTSLQVSGSESEQCLAQRSVLVRDLSMTGLYFTSRVPYRVGSWLEIKVALPGRIVVLPARVRRLDSPAHTEEGALETAFGCGMDILQSQVSSDSRRALMEYLIARPVNIPCFITPTPCL